MKSMKETVADRAMQRTDKCLAVIILAVCFLLAATMTPGAEEERQGNPAVQLRDLKEREAAVRKEEERLSAIKKDVEQKIAEYRGLLDKIEKMLSKIEQANDEKLAHAVKVYEAMPAEDAAARLSVIDEHTAVNILMQMKAKKAGAVISFMDPKKAASVTKSMTGTVKNFPTN